MDRVMNRGRVGWLIMSRRTMYFMLDRHRGMRNVNWMFNNRGMVMDHGMLYYNRLRMRNFVQRSM